MEKPIFEAHDEMSDEKLECEEGFEPDDGMGDCRGSIRKMTFEQHSAVL